MQPNVVGLVAGRGGENLKRLKQLPDVDSIEVYTNDADGQFEGRIHKQAGAHDRKWSIMEVKVGRLRVFHVRYSASFRVEMYTHAVWRHGSIFYLPVCLFSDVLAGLVGHCNSRGISTSREGSAENRTSTLGIAFKAFFDIFFGAMESF